MSDTVIIALISSIFGAGLMGFVEFLITRRDKKKGYLADITSDIASIKNDMKKAELDNVRTQMLLLMASYPSEQTELLKLAQHYFVELKGDWYMSPLFKSHLKNEGVPLPEWFN